MHARLWFAIVFGLSVFAPATDAQNAEVSVLPSTDCRNERHRARRQRPEQARRDSLWRNALHTIREELVRSAGEAGVAPRGVVLVRHNFLAGTGRMWMPGEEIPVETLRAAYTRAQPLMGLYPAGRSQEEAVFYVRLDPAPRDSVHPGDLVTRCRPQLRNQAEVRQIITDFAGRYSGDRSRPAHVDALVARDGSVLFTELRRSSGDLHVDDFAFRMVERMRFAPATINGVPVDVWVTQPVQVR